MKKIEEYLYFNEDEDYAFIKFSSATYDKNKLKLTLNYIYMEEVESKLPRLKNRLEELFRERIGLPLNYEFVYSKVYMDKLTLHLKILEFLKERFSGLTSKLKEENIVLELKGNKWVINLFLEPSLATFLQNSKHWPKFKQSLTDISFYEFVFYINKLN